LKILLAEDSGLIRKILEKSLTNWGYEVVLAEDGAQAWEILGREDAPRKVRDILDVEMRKAPSA
jgi:sigma-B regulation protein RsbU (phosphoserine phosphatase)